MAVKRTLGKLLLALVAATWLPPQAVICCASSESESCFAACCWMSCFLQATLAGWHGHRKPVSEHRDLDIARWLVQSKDFLVNLLAAVGTVAAAIVAFVALRFARRDSERAQRESKEGRTQAAADRMMEPFTPKRKKAEVVQRGIMKTIEERILGWDEHATIVAGRFGAGKSVAVEEALRDMKGVYVHTVWDKDWASSLYYDLGLDNLGMLQDTLRLVKERNQGSTPILVLEIPRTAKEGAVSATLVVLCLIRLGAGMDTVSTFAKILSSDSSLAHAGTRRLSRPVLLCCGRVLCKLSAGFLPR